MAAVALVKLYLVGGVFLATILSKIDIIVGKGIQ